MRNAIFVLLLGLFSMLVPASADAQTAFDPNSGNILNASGQVVGTVIGGVAVSTTTALTLEDVSIVASLRQEVGS